MSYDQGTRDDSRIEPPKCVANFAHARDTPVEIQLAHAGRKASTLASWVCENLTGTTEGPRHVALEDEGGWPNDGTWLSIAERFVSANLVSRSLVYDPTNISFDEDYAKPISPTKEEILRVEDTYLAAVERCKEIGFDFIEVYTPHEYLLSPFLSLDEHGNWRVRWPEPWKPHTLAAPVAQGNP